MNTDGNYPSGSKYDKNAPWNMKDAPEKEFNILCSQTLSKSVTVFTSNYTTIAETEKDVDGISTFVDCDTSDINWSEEYHANGYYTPLELLELFRDYLQDEINFNPVLSKEKSKEYKVLIKECSSWIDDETVYERE